MKWNFLPTAFRRVADTECAGQNHSTEISTPATQNLSSHTTHEDAIFIARQAIFDATEKVSAFQLFIRPDASLPETSPTTPDQSARLIVDTLNTFGVPTVLGERLGWIKLPASALQSDLVQLLPSAHFVLEYPAEFLETPAAEARCAQLLEQGYALALACNNSDMDYSRISKVASHVIYDLAQMNLQSMTRLDRAVKPYGLVRLVRNVNTRADFEACKAFGFDSYQGTFFAKTETMASKRIDPSRARIVEIFNLVMSKADIDEIEDAFKHDVALCYSLLCYINSVGIGMQYKVSSIRNAIMLLGYDFLWRWLSLLVYAGIDLSAAQRVLLNTAIIRGRLTELLGQINLPSKEANALFVAGNFSLLDALLGIPMEQALKRVNLPDEITRALLEHEGKYAPYLDLAQAFESNQWAQAARLCTQLNIELAAASRAHLAAIEWARMVAK
jgi:EAL and modified HD-GYP domain-containing signal transduction protein